MNAIGLFLSKNSFFSAYLREKAQNVAYCYSDKRGLMCLISEEGRIIVPMARTGGGNLRPRHVSCQCLIDTGGSADARCLLTLNSAVEFTAAHSSGERLKVGTLDALEGIFSGRATIGGLYALLPR